MSRTVALLCVLALAACGGSASPDGVERLDFGYEGGALRLEDAGRINEDYPIAIRDVSYAIDGTRVEAFLLLPPGRAKLPAAVFVHGAGGDRTQLVTPAAWLAARGVVTMTITAPSSAGAPAPAGDDVLRRQRAVVVRDVVAARRAVDVLASHPRVDADRIGYLGWSAGAKLGVFVAASDERVDALALLSLGAEPLAEFVERAPAELKEDVRTVLGSVDPLRYIAWARPGTLLLLAGRKDEMIPQRALRHVIEAAPPRTTVRWYRSGHALSPRAYGDALDWLTRKLDVSGPPVPGARTGPDR